jgi:molecular chaperone GrpE
VLEDFRGWLAAAAAGAVSVDRAPAERVDLFTLVAQFVALRHEVNLQTRAVRAQQEQNAATLGHLADVVDSLAQAQANQGAYAPRSPLLDASTEDLLRPLLKTLVDLYDSAALAGRELQRVQEAASAGLRPIEEIAAEELGEKNEPDGRPSAEGRPSWWSRWFGGRAEHAVRQREREARRERLRAARESGERIRQALAATAAGYAMTLQRVERTMAQHGLEAIPAVGERFDPERMEALEVVLDGARPSGEVVEEVRRGYLWQGRVFRSSQVRVAKSSSP